MFEDIIYKEEFSTLPKCNFIYRGHEKCPYYIPKESDHSVSPECDLYGWLTQYCYLNKDKKITGFL
jgi:hypothetical protein